MNASELITTFKSARRVSTPLVAVTSPDPAATIRAIGAVTNGSPLVCWDIVRGLQGLNPAGRDVVTAVLNGEDAAMRANPVESLTLANQFPEKTVCFALNSQRILGEYAVIQAVWNLRDTFKANGRTLVLLAPSLILPAELANDVLVLDEPLPDAAAVTEIVAGIHRDAGLPSPELDVMNKAIDAVCGLPAFPTEQTVAMSLTKDGLNCDGLWERKRKAIEQTKGLAVYRGRETFADIGGCENYKRFASAIMHGRKPPRAIVFMDEIEKTINANSQDDVSQDQIKGLLTEMQDRDYTGWISIGPPGAAKSLCAKATANVIGIPTIQLDLGAMRGRYQGDSETGIRDAFRTIYSVSQGETLWIATCNRFGALSPEIKRRFRLGVFYFDLPTLAECAAIWPIWIRKYELAEQPLPSHAGWTGAEIRQCCDIAWRLNISLADAARYIVPVCKSAAEEIKTLRKQASGKFTSASYAGVYRYEETETAADFSRRIEVQ